jgi:hypothetical protein
LFRFRAHAEAPNLEDTVMKVPSWTKPGIWGAVIGAAGFTIFGFSYLGWSTAGSADRLASERADAAVVAALVPFCVEKAQAVANADAMAKFRAETSSYSRSDIVQTAGWATLPGMTSPDSALARACSERLMTAGK